jgi:hypothetical protein
MDPRRTRSPELNSRSARPTYEAKAALLSKAVKSATSVAIITALCRPHDCYLLFTTRAPWAPIVLHF